MTFPHRTYGMYSSGRNNITWSNLRIQSYVNDSRTSVSKQGRGKMIFHPDSAIFRLPWTLVYFCGASQQKLQIPPPPSPDIARAGWSYFVTKAQVRRVREFQRIEHKGVHRVDLRWNIGQPHPVCRDRDTHASDTRIDQASLSLSLSLSPFFAKL